LPTTCQTICMGLNPELDLRGCVPCYGRSNFEWRNQRAQLRAQILSVSKTGTVYLLPDSCKAKRIVSNGCVFFAGIRELSDES